MRNFLIALGEAIGRAARIASDNQAQREKRYTESERLNYEEARRLGGDLARVQENLSRSQEENQRLRDAIEVLLQTGPRTPFGG